MGYGNIPWQVQWSVLVSGAGTSLTGLEALGKKLVCSREVKKISTGRQGLAMEGRLWERL